MMIERLVKDNKKFMVMLAITFTILVALPLCLRGGWISLVTEMLILSLSACSVNLLMGYTGMISFGSAGLYAVGAYTTAILLTRYNIPFAFALVSGPVIALIISYIVGWFCVRRTATYFALLTLAFGQLLHTIMFEWYGFTGGDDGIVGIELPQFLSSPTNCYYFILAIVLACLLLQWIIVKSPFGKMLTCIRENPERAEFIGIDVHKSQLIVFVIHGFFLGIAGSLFCVLNRNVFPDYANWPKGAEMLIACIFGGMHNFLGPVFGAITYLALDKLVVSFTEYWPLVLGLIVVLCVLFLPGGIIGFVSEKWRVRFRGERG